MRSHKAALLVLLATWGFFFIFLFGNILKFKIDGLYAGHTNVWSDWALHISIANNFAFKDSEYWFSYHPLYALGKFTYPFLTDFISAILMKLGLSLSLSFIIPSILISLFLILGVYFLFYFLLSSKKKAMLAIFIFFLSSGLGFLNFFSDFLKNPDLESIFYPIKEYSRYNFYQWYSGNVIVGLIAPQRNFLLGLTLGIWAILGFLYATYREMGIKHRRIILIVSGLLTGILPIVHAHGFIAVIIISSIIFFSNLKKWEQLLWFVIPAFLLSNILFFTFIYGGIENKSFFKFQPFWTAKDLFDWVKMWIILWGPMIPISVASFFLFDRKRRILFLGFFLIFILSNLFLFQPIPWDNSKLFWWSYLGFAALSSNFIFLLWQKNLLFKFICLILIFTLTFTGVLEIIRLSQIEKNSYMISSFDNINLGLKIRSETHPLDRFLTAPSHNHFIMIWALRPILMGYTAWVWNYGFEYQKTEQDIRTMFLGGKDTAKLLRKYGVAYVVIGPTEKSDLLANEEYFAENFPLAFSNSYYKVFDTRKVTISNF